MSASGSALDEVASYYTGKLAEHGTTAAGVDWNSTRSQEIRFGQLLKVADSPGSKGSINDYGCGYGALLDFISRNGLPFTYRGFDISQEMIEAARDRTDLDSTCFTTNPEELSVADYTIASGIFSVRLGAGDDEWLNHVLATLEHMRALSKRGFAFNMLTSYSDPDRIRGDLYYADPAYFLDHCIRNFSRKVAVLHDYELFEFTVLVRLETSDGS